MIKFGIFHNDIGLTASSFTEETNEKEVARVWRQRYEGTVDSLNYHVGVIDTETNMELNEEYRCYNCHVKGLRIHVEEIRIDMF